MMTTNIKKMSPLLNLHFFNIGRHHPTLKFKPHATDDERCVSGIDGVPLTVISVIKVWPISYHDLCLSHLSQLTQLLFTPHSELTPFR